MTRFAPALAALLLAVPAEAAPAPSQAPAGPLAAASTVPELPVLDDCDVAAMVGGEPITVRALDLMGPVQLALIKDDLYRSRRAALDVAIGRRLIEMEAKARNLSASAFYDSQTKALAAPVTDADVDELWAANPALAQQGTKEELRERLVKHLERQRVLELEAALIGRLSEKYASQVDVRLQSPRQVVPVAGHPSRGPADAPVTIVLFADFECGACAAMARTLDEIAAAHPRDVRLVHRDYPNEVHEHAVAAAAAARCADRLGRFWGFHDRLFAGPDARVTDEQLRQVARDLGLDAAAFEECFASEDVRADVVAERERARALGVLGTPHVFVNGLPLPGLVEGDFLERLVRTELALLGRGPGGPG